MSEGGRVDVGVGLREFASDAYGFSGRCEGFFSSVYVGQFSGEVAQCQCEIGVVGGGVGLREGAEDVHCFLRRREAFFSASQLFQGRGEVGQCLSESRLVGVGDGFDHAAVEIHCFLRRREAFCPAAQLVQPNSQIVQYCREFDLPGVVGGGRIGVRFSEVSIDVRGFFCGGHALLWAADFTKPPGEVGQRPSEDGIVDLRGGLRQFAEDVRGFFCGGHALLWAADFTKPPGEVGQRPSEDGIVDLRGGLRQFAEDVRGFFCGGHALLSAPHFIQPHGKDVQNCCEGEHVTVSAVVVDLMAVVGDGETSEVSMRVPNFDTGIGSHSADFWISRELLECGGQLSGGLVLPMRVGEVDGSVQQLRQPLGEQFVKRPGGEGVVDELFEVIGQMGVEVVADLRVVVTGEGEQAEKPGTVFGTQIIMGEQLRDDRCAIVESGYKVFRDEVGFDGRDRGPDHPVLSFHS